MNGDQIRDSFIQFFESKGHQHMPSASLIPAGDPTLLFTSAGMVPFKPFFMGEQTPPSRRLTSSQKSFRTTDIDEVGDHKHLTFFEMLGNFSIGDYFKEGAVDFAWELVTKMFKLEPERLFVTIHLDDDEAYGIWHDQVGVPEERIYRYGDKDNWWGPAGTEGPTGPCSEIHYDGGAEKGCGPMVEVDVLTALLREARDGAPPQPVPGCHPNCDCERFVELWNLVFMQYYQDPQRNRTPLPAPSVDTGMGLERAAVILQKKNNIYETDLFMPIIAKVSELTGKTYGKDADTDFAMRVVAEHSRAAAFLIGDGVVPGNEGRGYVLRRVIRRGIRYGRRLGLTGQFLTEVVEEVIPGFQAVYLELSENHDFILRVIRLEEERFGEAFERGNDIFDGMVAYRNKAVHELPQALVDDGVVNPDGTLVGNEGQNIGAELAHMALYQRIDSKPSKPGPQVLYRETVGELAEIITGKETFILYDTYGFPPELTAEIAREHGLEVDMEGFQREMEVQKEQSRSAQSFSGSMEMLTAYENLGAGDSEFTGYDRVEQDSVVAAILLDGSSVGHAGQGQKVEVVISQSPFYAEGGGQLGDHGSIQGRNGVVAVEDTQSPVAGLIVQRGVVEQGEIAVGDPVHATVDPCRRLDASRNHSGTHILHAALRSVLGPHVRQAGSLVAPERLRFDFSHVSQLTRDELLGVQSLANDRVRANLFVSSHETTYSDAVREGALAFFGDRYGDVVRVVTMAEEEGQAGKGAFSLEVCGGTHVSATGQVGTLLVLGESSIGGGMRRIEALTGRAAEQLFLEQSDRLDRLSRRLQTPVIDLETRLDSFMEETDELRRRLAGLERTALRSEAEALLQRAVDIDGAKVVVGRTSATNADGMREMGDFVKDKLGSVAVVLAAVTDGNPILVAMVTPDLVARGLNAGSIARDTAKVMGGGGGGKADMAQAGGRQPEKLDEALSGVAGLVRDALS
jgi:alanyl-tRNA synthetase